MPLAISPGSRRRVAMHWRLRSRASTNAWIAWSLRSSWQVLELRVLPLRNVFQRFSRVVREMSISLTKPVRLSIEGEDTEADKAIVEMLFEPLLHVVRNAMDHGVEPRPER